MNFSIQPTKERGLIPFHEMLHHLYVVTNKDHTCPPQKLTILGLRPWVSVIQHSTKQVSIGKREIRFVNEGHVWKWKLSIHVSVLVCEWESGQNPCCCLSGIICEGSGLPYFYYFSSLLTRNTSCSWICPYHDLTLTLIKTYPPLVDSCEMKKRRALYFLISKFKLEHGP